MPSRKLKKQRPDISHITYLLAQYIAMSLVVVGGWLITNDLLHILLMEVLCITTVWPIWFPTMLFVVIVVLVSHFLPSNISKRSMVICILFWMSATMAHVAYNRLYEYLIRIPRIESVSRMTTIQGDRVLIKGRHFGLPHQVGSVRVGDVEFIIVSWSDTRVVAEQPVPSHFFLDSLILTNIFNNSDQVPSFRISNPSEVL